MFHVATSHGQEEAIMEITSVVIRLVETRNDRDPLLAFAKLVFDDCFMVEDLRIIQKNDRIFVSMPSRKTKDSCHECGCKNELRARYCNDCGIKLRNRNRSHATGVKLFSDVAHPVNTEFRDEVENRVLDEYYKAYDAHAEAKKEGRRLDSVA